MLSDNKAAFSIVKIISIVTILLCFITIGIFAFNSQVKNVVIKISKDNILHVKTAGEIIKEVLEENHITLTEDETTIPNPDSKIEQNMVIEVVGTNESESYENTEGQMNLIDEQTQKNYKEIDLSQITSTYRTVTEKIEKVIETIPFETQTIDKSNGKTYVNKTIQEGKEGTKEIEYKVKYLNAIEVARVVVGTAITEEPLDKIIEKQPKQVATSRSGVRREEVELTNSIAKRVEGIEPIVKNMNMSAYTASTCGKSPDNPGYGRTASGAYATAYYTLASSSELPIGTVVYIPYFSGASNGGWFVVQDRGVASGKLDIYFDTVSECYKFGRRNLECYIYKF